jgi:hypothetical protein
LLKKKIIIKSKGTTKNRMFRCVYMSNELISKIIWRINFLFSKTWTIFMKQFWRWINFCGDLLPTWLCIESDVFFSNPQWNFMCYYAKVYFNIIPCTMSKHAFYIVLCTVLDELWIIKYIVCFSLLYWNK